jgi:hypothetical protein
MLHDLGSTVFRLTLGPGAKYAWEYTKPLILDRGLIEPPIALNRRKGGNAGKGRGHRKHPDPNSGQFRAYDAVIPRLLN